MELNGVGTTTLPTANCVLGNQGALSCSREYVGVANELISVSPAVTATSESTKCTRPLAATGPMTVPAGEKSTSYVLEGVGGNVQPAGRTLVRRSMTIFCGKVRGCSEGSWDGATW